MDKELYLYGTKIKPIPTEIINYRINLLQRNLKNELNVHFSKRNFQKVADISRAIEFWKNINK